MPSFPSPALAPRRHRAGASRLSDAVQVVAEAVSVSRLDPEAQTRLVAAAIHVLVCIFADARRRAVAPGVRLTIDAGDAAVRVAIEEPAPTPADAETPEALARLVRATAPYEPDLPRLCAMVDALDIDSRRGAGSVFVLVARVRGRA